MIGSHVRATLLVVRGLVALAERALDITRAQGSGKESEDRARQTRMKVPPSDPEIPDSRVDLTDRLMQIGLER